MRGLAGVPAGTEPGPEDWAAVFRALSEPLRLRILNLLLQREELCVCDLIEALDTPQSVVSRHLAYLRRHRLISARRAGVWMHYRVDTDEATGQLLQFWQQGPLSAAFSEDLVRLNQSASCC